jgi:hypothetical protein
VRFEELNEFFLKRLLPVMRRLPLDVRRGSVRLRDTDSTRLLT